MAAFTQAAFDHQVRDASIDQTVLVVYGKADFAPCRILAGAVQDVAARSTNPPAVIHVDIEEAGDVVRRHGVRVIPTVQAWSGGQLVDQFTGCLPPQAIADFLDRLAPDMAEVFRKDARLLAKTDRDAAARRLETGLIAAPGHPGLLEDLFRLHLVRERFEQAETALARLERAAPQADWRPLRRDLSLARDPKPARSADELRERIARDAGDFLAMRELARVYEEAGETGDAAEWLLRVVAKAHGEQREAARIRLLHLIGQMPAQDALGYRQRLAQILF